jgi:Putative amidoligase enzyme
MLTAELKPRRLGVEHECVVPLVGTGTGMDGQTVISNILNANGLPAMARSYSHMSLPEGIVIGVETDSSLRPTFPYASIAAFPVEIKTKVLSGIDEWEAVVPQTMAIVSFLGGRVNHTCGHHVHVSFDECQSNPRAVRSLIHLFWRFEPVIYGLVAPSRRTCGYSTPLELADVQSVTGSDTFYPGQWDRRHGLNLQNLTADHPHLELRYHNGTLNDEKARHWLRFCLQMVEHAVTRNCKFTPNQVENNRQGIEKLLVTSGFKPNSKVYGKVCPELRQTGRWLLRRWKALNNDSSLKAVQESEDADSRSTVGR